jgi:hypothetical protein
MKLKNLVIMGLLVSFVLAGCSTTRLTSSWSDPLNKKTYNNILVIGIAKTKLNRRAYEASFVANLRDLGIKAQASYELITMEQLRTFGNGKKGEFRKVVEGVLEKSNYDSVLITYVSSIEESTVYEPSMVYQPDYAASGYYGNMYGYGGYATTYVQDPGTYVDQQDYVLVSRLFDAKDKEVVWTGTSESTSPDSIEATIQDITKLLIKNLESRKLIK